MRVPALFPEAYVGDVHLRLALYKRIAAAPGDSEIDDLTSEIVDRFGALPPQAANLLRIARLRVRARRLGVRRMDFGSHGGYLVFEAQNSVDPKAVLRLIQDRSRRFRLDGPLKLRVSADLDTDAERFEFVAGLLGQLEGDASAMIRA
jgi:transcription-repair coupling factor (superfamily II helicase)